jgi:signal peptidase II
VLAADIISKTIVVSTLAGRQVRLLGGLVTLLETRNPGAAFSLGGPSETIIFSAIAVGVVIYIIRAARRIYSIAWAVALGLLLGGATGNLTDRIFRSPGLFRGWVVDWIEVPHWPVFNLADSAITCGGVLMVVLAVLGRGIEGKPRPASHPGEPAPGRADPADPPEQRLPVQAGGAEEPVPAQTGPEAADGPGPELAGADDPGPESAGADEPEPEHPAAKRAEPGSAQPEWPDPQQPQSQWPRSEWSDPEQSRQEHPAQDSSG